MNKFECEPKSIELNEKQLKSVTGGGTNTCSVTLHCHVKEKVKVVENDDTYSISTNVIGAKVFSENVDKNTIVNVVAS